LVGDGIYIELLSDPCHGGFAEAALAIGQDNDHGWQVSSVLFAILVELSVGGFRFMGVRNVRMWVSLVGLSVFAVTILRFFPGSWLSDKYFLNGIVGYAPIILIFYSVVYFFGLPTLQYFRLPRISLKTVFAILVASPLALGSIFHTGNEYKSWKLTICGAVFVLFIGFGEEMLSRGFVYGVLSRFGQYKAMFASSLMFGLMHINVYIPGNLGWDTYWHVTSTFGFGLIMCALMIVTRSIWVPVVFHALADWTVPFGKRAPKSVENTIDNSSVWHHLISPLFELSFSIVGVILILLINRAQPAQWMYRVALKWKLIKPEYVLTT
jgi:membrane protease YdiL (CAAX protease family)